MHPLTILALAAAAYAAPLEERQAGLCSSGSPLCCATDILNLAILDCQTRKFTYSIHTVLFASICIACLFPEFH